ncbi:hypothetical protein V8F06_007801 [Rhypophila decipiens]
MPPTEAEPKYTPAEISFHLHAFYTFLTTLHYYESDLKVPQSPDGWPSLSPSLCEQHNLRLYKSPLALQVLRHIPYFRETKPITSIHYKSILIDWAAIGAERFGYRYGGIEFPKDLYYDYFPMDMAQNISQQEQIALWIEEQKLNYKPCNKDMILLSVGHESGGRNIWLDVVHGRIWEDETRCDMVGNWDLVEYLDTMKGLLRDLKIIPAVGRICLDSAHETPERTVEEGEILLEDVLQDTDDRDGFFGTALHVQFVRQEYRRMGWPDAFRKEEAEDWVRMLDRVCEGRLEASWEEEWWFL